MNAARAWLNWLAVSSPKSDTPPGSWPGQSKRQDAVYLGWLKRVRTSSGRYFTGTEP